ncbi:MAG: beta-ketoacyl synthase N-terminal-like domain-containing protein [Phycisphaerales bacterium]
MRRGVCITGVGTVSALGLGVEALWEGMCAPRSALKPISTFDASGFACRLGGQLDELPVRDYVPKGYRKATKVMARDSEIAVVAARLAVLDARLRTRGSEDGEEGFEITPARTGAHIGAGLIAAETDELSRALATSLDDDGTFSLRKWGTAPEVEGSGGAMNNLPPLWMLKYLPNMLACHVTIVHGAEGPSNTITCFDSSALLCLGESARVIERGAADICFSGGAESKLNYMGMLRLEMGGRLAETGDETDGSRLVRPYDPGSAGTLIGEGGGILILEETAHARARGAKAYAEVAGFGAALSPNPVRATFDGAPEADEGLSDAIEAALRDAGVSPSDIDAIVPAGLGVPSLDRAEAGALRRVFADRLASIPLVTSSPNFGACHAGQGGLQAALGAVCLRRQMLPARIHGSAPARGLDAGACDMRDADLSHVLVCTGALGGQNAALVLRRTGG